MLLLQHTQSILLSLTRSAMQLQALTNVMGCSFSQVRLNVNLPACKLSCVCCGLNLPTLGQYVTVWTLQKEQRVPCAMVQPTADNIKCRACKANVLWAEL